MNAFQPQKLSHFQSLMRGWSELAPYNFIHALRFDEPADMARWHSATTGALWTLGLETRSFAIETPSAEIDAHFEAELHRGFAASDIPLRFFVIETRGGGHWFGVVLDHWFADDFSSRALLRRIHSSYRGGEEAGELPQLSWAKRPPPRRSWMVEWSSFLKQAAALRRAWRLPLEESLDFTVGAFRTELPRETLEIARALAKEQCATVHDVFLAAAAQASGAACQWPAGASRDSIGLASAMDLRRFEEGVAREAFGLLIGQYSIVERRPETVPLPELIARIAEQTRGLRAISGRALFVAGLLAWRLARSRRAKATLYQRGSPFAAGLSNVNLSGSWIEQSGIAEFRRVASAGPAVPLVLMITTLHGRIFVDTTFRTRAFARPDAEKLIADFAARLGPGYQPFPGSA